jgi:hypothetical protein
MMTRLAQGTGDGDGRGGAEAMGQIQHRNMIAAALTMATKIDERPSRIAGTLKNGSTANVIA